MAQAHTLLSCLCGCVYAVSFCTPFAFLYLKWEIKTITPRCYIL